MCKPYCKQLEDSQTITDDGSLYAWIQAKAKKEHLTYLLAHADDGVIWGKFRGNDCKLVTSGDDDLFPKLAKLRLSTLQQCRIFGENAEVMLWKVGQNWKARSIEDGHLSKDKDDYICEKQILWGTQAEEEKHEKGFTLVSDGSQGLKHAVPLTWINFKGKDSRPLRLQVRHYIEYDESGVARIYLSRLVDLYSHSKK
ncbi:type III-D CRISPR-associated protein Csx19 [Microcoleus sp. herbarium12]|uniref:type III-D CRISPR-associated protein Csx19 n=1 Tax=Microcoleus sp. herbarium12 TaxID=3055437 RepID=UPI002FD3C10C